MKKTHARPSVKLLAAATALMLIVIAVSGCGTASPTQQPTTASTTATAAATTTATSSDPLQPKYDASMYSEALTIDVYSDSGTYNGMQPDGWFSKIVQDKFNMKLNIIGGQSASGDAIYQARSAAGNLGDLIFISNQHLSDAVKAGKALVVLPEKDEIVERASGNIPNVKTTLVGTLNVYEILKYDTLILTKDSLAKIEEVYA